MGTNDGERAVAPRHETPNRTDFKRQRFSQNFHFFRSFPYDLLSVFLSRRLSTIRGGNIEVEFVSCYHLLKTLSTWRVHEDGRSRGGKVHVTSSTCTTSPYPKFNSVLLCIILYQREEGGEGVHITRRVRISKSGLFDIYFRAVRAMPVVNDTSKSCAPIAGR